MKVEQLINKIKQAKHTQTTEAFDSKKNSLKEKLMAQVAMTPQDEPVKSHSRRFNYTSWMALFSFKNLPMGIIPALVILLVLTGTAYASNNSLPGDVLYPVKRGVEETRLVLASSEQQQAELQIEFSQKRVKELEALETKHKPQPVKVEVNVTTPDANKTEPDQSNSNNDNGNDHKTISERFQEQAQQKANQEIQKSLDSLKSTKNRLENRDKSRNRNRSNTDTLNRLNEQIKKLESDFNRNRSDSTNRSGGDHEDRPPIINLHN